MPLHAVVILTVREESSQIRTLFEIGKLNPKQPQQYFCIACPLRDEKRGKLFGLNY
jgi:hypothetical protein